MFVFPPGFPQYQQLVPASQRVSNAATEPALSRALPRGMIKHTSCLLISSALAGECPMEGLNRGLAVRYMYELSFQDPNSIPKITTFHFKFGTPNYCINYYN